MATRISKNFTLDELTASATAKQMRIINAPGVDEVCNLCALVHNVLQPLRDAMGESIKIGSGYRCPQLNKAVGGVSNSQHMKGEAADLCIEPDHLGAQQQGHLLGARVVPCRRQEPQAGHQRPAEEINRREA